MEMKMSFRLKNEKKFRPLCKQGWDWASRKERRGYASPHGLVEHALG